MKTLARTAVATLVAGLTLLAMSKAAQAQAHGIPASATSLSDMHGRANPPGIPASVSSPGPRGFGMVAFQNPRPDRDNDRDPDRDNDRREERNEHPRVIPVFVPTYGYGYGYPYPYNYDPNAMADTTQPQVEPAVNVYRRPVVAAPAPPPQIIVIDNRGTHAASDSERASLLEPPAEAKPPKVAEPNPPAAEEDLGPATVLIFRDGTRKEIRNYVIMGKQIIDIGKGSLKRYELADLDLPATTKENDGRGLAFKLP